MYIKIWKKKTVKLAVNSLNLNTQMTEQSYWLLKIKVGRVWQFRRNYLNR